MIGEIVEFSDIFEIYCILGEQGRICFVIVKLRNSDLKIKIIKYRLKDGVKSYFKMYDYIIYQNVEFF